jgi:GntR family transcriptional regulator
MKHTAEYRPGTVLEMLDLVLPQRITRAQQVVEVAPVPADIARLIDCVAGDKTLRIKRLFLSGDTPVEYVVAYFNPERHAYRLELRRITQ